MFFLRSAYPCLLKLASSISLTGCFFANAKSPPRGGACAGRQRRHVRSLKLVSFFVSLAFSLSRAYSSAKSTCTSEARGGAKCAGRQRRHVRSLKLASFFVWSVQMNYLKIIRSLVKTGIELFVGFRYKDTWVIIDD